MVSASDEYKEAVKNHVSDDYLQSTPGILRRLAFAIRIPQSLRALHLEGHPYQISLVYYAVIELVQKANSLLSKPKQLYLNDRNMKSSGNKGLLGAVAQEGLTYRKLPDPFRARSTYSRNTERESDIKDDSDEEEDL